MPGFLRTIAPGVMFFVEGQGKSRRYVARKDPESGMVGMVDMVLDEY
jgi:hypothetical protein